MLYDAMNLAKVAFALGLVSLIGVGILSIVIFKMRNFKVKTKEVEKTVKK